MSVKNAGFIIREARLKAGLTQEQLSDGICSVLSLSRIENGSAGVSPSTFQALMAHAGAPCEAYPAFASRADFDCFYRLNRVRFYLDSWQLREAFDELEQVEKMQWADNKFYCQEWFLLHCLLQFRSGCADHAALYDTVLTALHISKPDFDPLNLHALLLSKNEIELCILLAQEALHQNDCSTCLSICSQLSDYLAKSGFSYLEKDRLLAENAIVYTKYLIAAGEYEAALKTADHHRHCMAQEMEDAPLHELTFLTALGYYYTGDKEQALSLFLTAFLSAHSIGNCYATICRNYAATHLALDFPATLSDFADIPLVSYPKKETVDTTSMGDGTYNLFSPDTLTIGSLIRELRTEQKLSQTVLCLGLCSKSMLSKIENGTLQPSILLAQTLLQRLGLSDFALTFYGNENETALQELKLRLVHTRIHDAESLQNYLRLMEERCTSKDTLYLQYILYRKSSRESNPEVQIMQLHQALSMTLPDFDFKNILNYRLSWMELSILNTLCFAYIDNNLSTGIFYFYKLLEYFDHATIDILEKKRLYPVTAASLIQGLYRKKRFDEIMELMPNLDYAPLRSTLYFTGHIYSHYSQSLGELKLFEPAAQFGNYSVQNFMINEDFDNAQNEKQDFLHDFQISLL